MNRVLIFDGSDMALNFELFETRATKEELICFGFDMALHLHLFDNDKGVFEPFQKQHGYNVLMSNDSRLKKDLFDLLNDGRYYDFIIDLDDYEKFISSKLDD